MGALYIGLMSGTSLDGVDAVLLEAVDQGIPHVLRSVSLDYPPALRSAVLSLTDAQGGRFSAIGRVDVELGRWYASAVSELLRASRVAATSVRAIGCHGQTVHHEPFGDAPFSLQLGDPNTVAALTGIAVVADFRRRDMALGGQGAPLAPGFHDAVFRHPSRVRVVLNCGGIANISVLKPDEACIGYDTGPANILMDGWMQTSRKLPFDRNGELASQGTVNRSLLQSMRSDPYFGFDSPKSTGREYFNLHWLNAHLGPRAYELSDADIMATLLELSATTISDAIQHHAITGDLLVAGGGAKNRLLLNRLRQLNPRWSVDTTDAFGIPAQLVEAIAFAVFAQRTMDGLSGNLPGVTGASRPCVLGGIYPP